MKAILHIVTIGALGMLLLAVPLLANVYVDALVTGWVDVVSEATEIQETPDTGYTVFINADLHPDAKVLADWETFFSGEDAPLIMEDISCRVIEGDEIGMDVAWSLQSRLPANRMRIRAEEGVLAFSKAEAGWFDVMVVSDECAEMYCAFTLEDNENIVVVHR